MSLKNNHKIENSLRIIVENCGTAAFDTVCEELKRLGDEEVDNEETQTMWQELLNVVELLKP